MGWLMGSRQRMQRTTLEASGRVFMSGFPASELPRTAFNVRTFNFSAQSRGFPLQGIGPGKSQARGVAQKARRFLSVGFRQGKEILIEDGWNAAAHPKPRRPRGNRRCGTRTLLMSELRHTNAIGAAFTGQGSQVQELLAPRGRAGVL